MIEEFIKKLENQNDLTRAEIENFVDSTVELKNSPNELKTVLNHLSTRDVGVDEMYFFVKALRKHSVQTEIDPLDVTDSCGTGADGAKTFNISTTAAILASAAGAKVVKQTNSHITSRSGSSDFLNAMGVPIAQNPREARELFLENGITFLHSPSFNNFARIINPIRQEVKKRTLFNFTGPLINPVFPKNQVIGVSDPKMAKIIIQVLQKLELTCAYVVCAENPLLDEVSMCSPTTIYELREGKITSYTLSPEDVGLKTVPLQGLRGATPVYNANLAKDILNNRVHGAKTDVVALNCALMLMSAGLAKTIQEGVILSYRTIIEGKASEKLEGLLNGHRLLKTL